MKDYQENQAEEICTEIQARAYSILPWAWIAVCLLPFVLMAIEAAL